MPTTIPGGGGLGFSSLLARISLRYGVIAQRVNPTINPDITPAITICVIGFERALGGGESRADVDTEDVRVMVADAVLL